MRPLISIIIPVYNAEKYLCKCLDSIIKQTFTDFEVLLIDDGSTDNSGEICDYYAKLDNRITVFHKTNEGVSSARNMGLNNAVGEWITFVDADDWLDVNIYNKLYYEAVVSNADIVLCDFYFYYNENNLILYNTISTNKGKDDIMRDYIISFTSLCNMLVHRSLYDKTYLRIPQNLTVCEDFWLSVQLFYYAKKISSVHIPLYYYNRENVNSILNNHNKTKFLSEINAYLDIVSFFEKKNVLNLYHREISWRILKCKQDLVLDPHKHKQFMRLYPKSHKYILSCPDFFCNKKIKILMWMLVNYMRPLVLLLCKVRELKGNGE